MGDKGLELFEKMMMLEIKHNYEHLEDTRKNGFTELYNQYLAYITGVEKSLEIFNEILKIQ